MAQIEVEISRGATDPDLEFVCQYTDGTVQDLTGWTVNLVWAPSTNGSAPEAGASYTTDSMTVTDAEAGTVSYAWPSTAGAMITTVGHYVAQVHATSGAETIIFPEPGTYISIQVLPSLAA